MRTFWEEYVGWFKLRSTTELYPDTTAAALAGLLDAAGTDIGLERAETALERGDAVLAIKLGEALAAAGLIDDTRLRKIMTGAHTHLYDHGSREFPAEFPNVSEGSAGRAPGGGGSGHSSLDSTSGCRGST